MRMCSTINFSLNNDGIIIPNGNILIVSLAQANSPVFFRLGRPNTYKYCHGHVYT